MGDRLAPAGLNAVAGLLYLALPERDPHPLLFRRTVALLGLLDQTDLWPLADLQWELAILEDAGFGFDLTRCAGTGVVEGLIYVSPCCGGLFCGSGAASRSLSLYWHRDGTASTTTLRSALGLPCIQGLLASWQRVSIAVSSQV